MNHRDYEQQQALIKKRKQMEIPIELIKIQDTYNRSNIKQQHKFNLEIFEKQSALTLEIYKKQSKLVKFSIGATLFAALCGAGAGYYTAKLQSKPQVSTPPQYEQSSQQRELGKTSVHRKEVAEPSEPMESSSTSNSLKTPISG